MRNPEHQQHECSLCRIKFRGWGNNPWPLGEPDQRCCDDCNSAFVIAARLGTLTTYQCHALRSLTERASA